MSSTTTTEGPTLQAHSSRSVSTGLRGTLAAIVIIILLVVLLRKNR